VERTTLVDGKAVGTGELRRLPADLVVSCIGYQTSPIAGVPYDEMRGRFANEEGRILPGLYCVGWARRGPSGTIGTNRPDGFAIVDRIAQDLQALRCPNRAATASMPWWRSGAGCHHLPRLAEDRCRRSGPCAQQCPARENHRCRRDDRHRPHLKGCLQIRRSRICGTSPLPTRPPISSFRWVAGWGGPVPR
jgi:hypothetical protein